MNEAPSESSDAPRAHGRDLYPLWLVLAAAAGLASLVCEVTWARMLSLVFGSTVNAVTSVLVIFLGGLALGSFLMGRLADRQERVLLLFAGLQVGAGISALLFPVALRLFDGPYLALVRGVVAKPAALTLVSLLLAIPVLIIPTTLMGATIPVLARFVVRRSHHLGGRAGGLYATNTLGAAAGALLAGFWLIRTIGLTPTAVVAGLVSVVVGLVAFAFSRQLGPEARLEVSAAKAAAPAGEISASAPVEHLARRALIVFTLSGFCALAYEVLWTRLLVFAVDSTVYALSLMLTVVLLGLAIGAALSGMLAHERSRGFLLLGLIEAAVGLSAVVSLGLLARWDAIAPFFLRLAPPTTSWRWDLQRLLGAGTVLLVPSVFLGATFPLAARLYARSARRVGGGIGRLLAANTAAGALGALVAALVLLPLLGTEGSILLLALVNAALGIWLLVAAPELGRTGRLAVPAALVLALLAGRGLLVPEKALPSLFNMREPQSTLLTYREGAAGTVTVHQYPQARVISVNGVNVAGTDLVLQTAQKLMAHIPCLLHPHARKVLHIGAGSGLTARSLLLEGVEEIDEVEICPDLAALAPRFDDAASGVLADPRVHRITADGRAFVQVTRGQYDLVLNDVGHPAVSGNADLYTVEYFRACRARLAPDGLCSTWLPLFGLKPQDVATIIRTFREVFPHSTLWVANNCINRHALLVGSAADAPFTIDWSRAVLGLLQVPIATDLAEINQGDILAFLDCFLTDEKGLAAIAEAGRIHLDGRPVLDFSAPRVPPRDTELVASNLGTLVPHRTSVYPLLVSFAPSGTDSLAVERALERTFAASTQVWRGIILDLRGSAAEPEAAYRAALEINPDDRDAALLLREKANQEVALTQALAQNPADAGSRLELARLRLRQGNYPDALAAFEEAVPAEKRDDGVWYDMGVCLGQLGEFGRAMEAYQHAIALNPRSPEPHVNLGVIYQRQGRFEQAVAEYRAALRIDPQHAEANYNLGVAYAQRGLHADAIPYFEKAVAVRPTYADAFYNLGISRASSGNLPGAVEAWRQVLALVPDHQAARANISRALAMMSQPPLPEGAPPGAAPGAAPPPAPAGGR